jgi:flagellin
LAESINLNAQIGQTTAANANVSNAVSFAQTQDGYLQQVGSALDQMSTLAVEAQDGTKTDTERADYQKEFSTLAGYITNTGSASFNGVSLFSSAALAVTTDGNGGTFSMTGVDLTASAYTGATAANVSTTAGAVSALTAVTAAITQLATDRATVGASEERLNYTGQELGVLSTNLSAANSQITDVDVAQESTNYAKYQILVQSGTSTSMLAQANQNPQSVLKLLQ